MRPDALNGVESALPESPAPTPAPIEILRNPLWIRIHKISGDHLRYNCGLWGS